MQGAAYSGSVLGVSLPCPALRHSYVTWGQLARAGWWELLRALPLGHQGEEEEERRWWRCERAHLPPRILSELGALFALEISCWLCEFAHLCHSLVLLSRCLLRFVLRTHPSVHKGLIGMKGGGKKRFCPKKVPEFKWFCKNSVMFDSKCMSG